MPDYLRQISRVSSNDNKSYNMPYSLLRLFFYLNSLNDKCNSQMMMKSEDKPLLLLGKYKIEKINLNLQNKFSEIIFINDNQKIIIRGHFILLNNTNIHYMSGYKISSYVMNIE